MGWAPTLLSDLTSGARPLDRPILRRLGRVLCNARPEIHDGAHDALLPVRAVREDGHARLAFAPTDLAGWWWATDVLAGGLLSGGSLPKIDQAVELIPVGVQSGLSPLRLPTGRPVDLTRDDLGIAFGEERHNIREDTNLPLCRRDLLDKMLKRTAVALCFGNLARLDRERQPGLVFDEAISPDGQRLAVRHAVLERRGPYCSPALAGMVTAAGRAVVAHTVAGIRAEGGTVLAVNIDSLLIAATYKPDPEFVLCPGEDVHIGRRDAIRALPLATIEKILERTDAVL
jgi:hypothetical protein